MASAGGEDIFVAALSSAGQWRWAAQAGGAGDDQAWGITSDSAGNALVAGWFNATATFGATPLTSAGGSDAFVAKLSPAGSWLWARSATSAQSSWATSVASDAMDGVWITGTISGPTTFGTHQPSPVGGNDVFVAHLSPAGQWLSARAAGGQGDDQGRGVTIGTSGDVFVSGVFSSTARFDDAKLTSAGDQDVLIWRSAP